MFDLGWTEIAVIVVVAVVVIGPKDLPAAVRGVAHQLSRLRRWAGEMRGTLDEVVREAKLEDVRDQINEIRNFDVRGEVERAVDPTGDLKKTFQDDPLRDPVPAWTPPPPPKTAAETPDAPAFVPPQTLAPLPPVAPPPPVAPAPAAPAAPSFLPPSTPAPIGVSAAEPPAPIPVAAATPAATRT
jgi:sec-independent protein translocase protein TatB